MGEDVGFDSQPDVAFAKHEVVAIGLEGWWLIFNVAGLEEVEEPSATLGGGHSGADEFDSVEVSTTGGLLSDSNLLAVAGVVGHHGLPLSEALDSSASRRSYIKYWQPATSK